MSNDTPVMSPMPRPACCRHPSACTTGWLTRRDWEPYIGLRGRVADILNRTRPLTLEMIRRLAEGLRLPAEVPIKPYRLRRADEELAAA